MIETYDYRTNLAGSVEVLAIRQQVLGTFDDEEHALLFLNALKGRSRAAASPVADEPAQGEPQILSFQPRPAPDPEPAPQAASDLAAPLEPAEPAPAVPVTVPTQENAHTVVLQAGTGFSISLPAASLPAVAPRPRPPVIAKPAPLPAEIKEKAFRRLEAGETVMKVAVDLGVPFGRLRGAWANKRRQDQDVMRQNGTSSCSRCEREFMPSPSSPDLCARCARSD